MQTMATSKVIDLSAHFIQIRCDRRRRQMHTVFALWTQYLSLAALLLAASLALYASTNPIPGNEGPGLRAVQAAIAFIGALVAGCVFRFRQR